MAQKLMPLAGYCLIEPLDEEQQTSEGLYLPEKAKDKPEKGKVIAIGADLPRFDAGATYIKEVDRHKVPNEMCPVKVGDKVIFYKWAGSTIKNGDKEYLLVKFADLQGVYQ